MRPRKRIVPVAPSGESGRRVRTRKGRYTSAAPEVVSPPEEQTPAADLEITVDDVTLVVRQVDRPDKFEARSLGGFIHGNEIVSGAPHPHAPTTPEWSSERWFEGDHYFRQDTRLR